MEGLKAKAAALWCRHATAHDGKPWKYLLIPHDKIDETKTLAGLAQLHDVHTTQIALWKAQLLEGAAGVFSSGLPAQPASANADLKTLHAKIGELTLENDFLSAALGKAGLPSTRR